MDFDIVHRQNILGQYSNPTYIENPYTHQANDHNNKVFSALSHQVEVKNLDSNNPSVEGSSWDISNPNSDLLCSPFDYPFYLFHQSCFGKSNQEYYLSAGYCTTPFVQEHDVQDLHVSSNVVVNVDRSRGPFSTMDRYQMDEDLDYSEKTSLSNGRFSDNDTKKMSKRKRIIDNKSDIIKGQWSPEEDRYTSCEVL
ncbi:Unknown protein [Striga hermonthica]|uniref:Uncharacterized protein n=1 Tax=Striga hermonthica TaxID=68872 RepID=A0A9N7N1C3_STRHE|nr:Unknown protein [Striga hermonthica]